MPEAVIPPVLYLPLRVETSGEQSPQIFLHTDGTRILPAFTALDRLATACGSEQPWVLVHSDDLARIREQTNFDQLNLDPRIGSNLKSEGRLK